MKGVTDDVAELKLIIRTTDKLVDAIKEQGKQTASAVLEGVEQSFDKNVGWEQTRNQTMVQFIWKLGWNLDYRYWDSPRMSDTNSKIEMNNERQRRQNNIIVYNLALERRWKVKKKKNSCQSSWKK